MKNDFLPISDLLLGAVLNGVLQGIIITLLVALGLRLAARSNAATRYAIWFCALLLLAGLPIANAIRGFRAAAQRDAAPEKTLQTVLTDPAPSAAPALASISSYDSSGQSIMLVEAKEATRNINIWEETDFLSGTSSLECDQAHVPIPPELFIGVVESPDSTKAIEPPQSIPMTAGNVPPESHATPAQSLVPKLASFLSSPRTFALGSRLPKFASLVLLGVWAVIAVVKIGVLLWRLKALQRLKAGSIPASAELKHLFQDLRTRLGITRNVDFRLSSEIKSPAVLGFRHPTIVFPDRQVFEQVEPVLRHELAHVQRRDDWTNLIQQSINAVLFFHPGIWWISKQLSLEREIACDDAVLQHGGKPRTYALLLADLAGRMQGSGRASLLAPGVSTNKSQLKQRIDMILNTTRNTSSRLERLRVGAITCVASLAAVAAVYAAPKIVLAQGEIPPVGTPEIASGVLTSSADLATEAAEGSNIEVTQEAPIAPPPPGEPEGIDPGPKFKPGEPGLKPHPPIAIQVTPMPPVPPAPIIAAMPHGPEPRPGQPARVHNPDVSLEERLNRLERMVQSLIAQQGVKPRFEFHMKDSIDHDGKIDKMEMDKIEGWARQQAEQAKHQAEQARRQMEYAKKQLDEQDVDKIKEQARKEAMRAAEDARRAGREAGRAGADERRQGRDKMREGPQKQLEALRKHREVLQREMEKLERQMEELERHREKLDDQFDQSSDENDNDNNNENNNKDAAPEPAAR